MKTLALGTLAIALLAGCAGEAYVAAPGPAPVYVEPYPDPYFYGPDVYIYGDGHRHYSHYRDYDHWRGVPRYDRAHPRVPPVTGAPPPAYTGRGSSRNYIPQAPHSVPMPQRRDRH
jgi:hypothetical protein